ncbi:MAG: H-NS family nucleoid-associated regulatory protein [Xanthobacteraceae bacterium]
MAGLNIKSLDVDALLALRAEIDKRLSEQRRLLEKQLSLLSSDSGSGAATARAMAAFDRRKFSALKGRKIEPKYRGPGGETWAGRGAQPRWLSAALKSGKKLEDFLIEKSGRRQARKPRAKRQQA